MFFVVAVFAALSSSSAFAQCRGGSGGMGGSAGTGTTVGTAGTSTGTGLASFGTVGASTATGQGQTGHGFFAVPTEQMFQPAFPHIVDDNRQYVAERRALRAARAEQARQRLAARKERPAKHRILAAHTSQDASQE
jgi:hypothetical protein